LKIINANLSAQIKYGSHHNFLKKCCLQLHPSVEEIMVKNYLTRRDELPRITFTHILSDGKEIKVNLYVEKLIAREIVD
jgi:hypothetical protein